MVTPGSRSTTMVIAAMTVFDEQSSRASQCCHLSSTHPQEVAMGADRKSPEKLELRTFPRKAN
jgi:hypothetical protein